ncbi:DNA-binding protein [Paraburkholderia phenazinium]|uniref:DNA-binding protein n=1 Tax=Paraburkholderia phenazinium TaxID=60549 RepID=UPI00158BB6FD|nr:DNA-binding protein [Paraburkholderia phenazinium]
MPVAFAITGLIDPFTGINGSGFPPPSVPLPQARRTLAGVLVYLLDTGMLEAVKGLMTHELFDPLVLHEMVQSARQETDENLRLKMREFEESVLDATQTRDRLEALIGQMRDEAWARAEATRKQNRSRIAPAQAKRTSDAQNAKIIAELNRRKRNGEDYQGRSVCSELAARFGVSADHARKVRKKWNSGFRPAKRD